MSIDTTFVHGFGDAIIRFVSDNLILVALVASAGWFYGGQQYLRKGNPVGAFLWQGIAMLVLIAFCVNVLLKGTQSWFGLTAAVAAIVIEAWLMKRWLSGQVRSGG